MEEKDMESIHSPAQGKKNWDGQYFGRFGALAHARHEYDLTQRMSERYGEGSGQSLTQRLINDQLLLMSTVFGALGHCVAQIKVRRFNNKPLYAWRAMLLYLEIRFGVAEIFTIQKLVEKLNPSQRDVMIAACYVGSFWNGDGRLFLDRAARLVRANLKDPEAAPVTVLFAKARATKITLFSQQERDLFWKEVSWEIEVDLLAHKRGEVSRYDLKDLARLARLIGDKERQKDAAVMDGSPDVKLKAGL
jgi:hypothetical protein